MRIIGLRTDNMNLTKGYEDLRDNPLSLVGDMTFDEYCDWLDLGSKEDLQATLKVFQEKGLDSAYTRVIQYKIKQWK